MRPVTDRPTEVAPRFKSTADPAPKQRKRIAPKSKRVIDRQPERDACRAVVLERAGHCCQYAPIWPGLPCGSPFTDRPQLEVDEVRGGSYRAADQYDPHWCRAACQLHHDIKTRSKTRALVARIMEET